MPTKNSGGNLNAIASAKASNGNSTICPTRAIITARGCLSTRPKSLTLSVRPRSNISNDNIGKTISMAFIFLNYYQLIIFEFLNMAAYPPITT